jgi:Chromo (CHRromatin Organisation MOdifier) domain
MIGCTAYHPQTNGQVERYNRTILAALRGYVARRQDDWDEYTSTLTYAYNCRVHSSLGMPPFELALSRPPPTTSLQDLPREEKLDPTSQKRAFLERLKTLKLRADGKLSASQLRYKKDHDRGVSRQKNAHVREGDYVYVRVEVTEVGRSHKMDSLVHGPYRVVENAGHTFRLQMGLDVIRISSDRVTPAPPNSIDNQPRSTAFDATGGPPTSDPGPVSPPVVEPETPNAPRQRKVARKRVHWAPETETRARTRDEYVIERIVDSGVGEDGAMVYRVRWVGYSPEEDSWQLAEHLPSHFVRRYERAQARKRRGTLLISELLLAGRGNHF